MSNISFVSSSLLLENRPHGLIAHSTFITPLRPAHSRSTCCRKNSRALVWRVLASIDDGRETSSSENAAEASSAGTNARSNDDVPQNVGDGGADANVDTVDNVSSSQNLTQLLQRALRWQWSILKKAAAPGGFLWGMGAGVIIMFGVFFGPWAFDDGGSLRQKVALFDYILQDLEKSYVDNVNVDKLFETGMNSMLASLDPYCEFKSNAHSFEVNLKTAGKYGGVGLAIATSDDLPDDQHVLDAIPEPLQNPDPLAPAQSEEEEEVSVDRRSQKDKPLHKIVVVSAFEGYAFDAGVRPGDVVLSVDNNPATGMSLEEVSQFLRGDPGTDIRLTVTRPGYPDPLTFTLRRQDVKLKNVPAYTFLDTDKSIGYVRLQSFAREAADEVRAAIRQLHAQQSKPLQGLILDLRSNPGGLLSAAVETAETLLPNDSPIVSTRGRNIGAYYQSTASPAIDPSTKIAIMVNRDTASASEVVAGAVQDLDAGVIVGTRTFGKGLVQNLQELPFQSSIKYTVGKYYTPSGRCIQEINYQAGDEGFISTKNDAKARKEFRTSSGRVVRDGAGIDPDVTVKRTPSFLEQALQTQNMYFSYAGKYAGRLGPSVVDVPTDFIVSDALYRDFVKYVTESKSFRYQNQFEDELTQLESTFGDFGYGGAKRKVSELKRAAEDEMRVDFVRHERDIRRQLEDAIRHRFQPDSKRLIAALKNDEQVEEAMKVLKDPRVYEGLLRPRKVMLVEESKPQEDILGSLRVGQTEHAD